MRLAIACALLLASCQNKTETNAKTSPPPPQGSASVATPGPDPDAPDNAQPQLPLPSLPSPLPGKRTDLTAAIGSAQRAAIGDFDGDKKREIVVADAKTLRVIDAAGKEIASAPVSGGIHVLVAADIDGDGKAEILAGWGQSREYMSAKARITLHRLTGTQLVEEVLAEPETSRAEVVAIVPLGQQELLVGYYDAKYTVTSAYARKKGKAWELETIASIRMATSYARGDVTGDGKPDLVVGRMYGDDKGIDGDAFVLAPDGSRTKLPTTRGLRSLAIAGNDIYVGDGWHQNYGQHARGLLTRIHHDKDGFHAELVENTPGQYAIERILPATIGGKQVIIALGSHYVRVFTSGKGTTVAGAARDIAVGDLDGKPGDELLVVGDTSELIDLAGAL